MTNKMEGYSPRPSRGYLKSELRHELLEKHEEQELARSIEGGVQTIARLTNIELTSLPSRNELLELLPDPVMVAEYDQNTIADAYVARDRFIMSNQGIVISLAKRYVAVSGSSMDLSDLVQEGNHGLMKAVDNFDYRKGFKFSTYAAWWIRQSITRSIADQSRLIRIPVHQDDLIRKIRRLEHDALSRGDKKPSDQEIAVKLDADIQTVELLRRNGTATTTVSLNKPVGEDGGIGLEDLLAGSDTMEQIADRLVDEQQVDRLLGLLKDRERDIIRLRYGIGYERPYTAKEIAGMHGITRERIVYIEKRALRYMSDHAGLDE